MSLLIFLLLAKHMAMYVTITACFELNAKLQTVAAFTSSWMCVNIVIYCSTVEKKIGNSLNS